MSVSRETSVKETRVNRQYCTDSVCVHYPHVGLFDALESRLWIARDCFGLSPVRVSHARLLVGGTHDTSTASKDRFVCYWFHTPGSGEGYVHGYPIEWGEAHVLIRLDPNWDYRTCQFIPSTQTARVERNIEQQYAWGRKIFGAYAGKPRPFPLSWHMVGPRLADSMFYIQRVEKNAD